MEKFRLINVSISYKCNKQCDFCYAKGLVNDYNDMTLKDFQTLLDWFKKFNIKNFNFIGGEPTYHPEIKKFIQISYDKGYEFNMLTNGIFDIEILRLLNKRTRLIINYNYKDHYNSEEYKLLHQNLEYLKKNNYKFTIGILITNKYFDIEYFFKVIKKINPSSVKLDMVMPNSIDNNEHLNRYDYKEKRELLLKFVDKIKLLGIKVFSSRAMPYCIYNNVHKNSYYICGVGKRAVLINPDLTIFPCVSLFIKGPKITSINKDPVKFIRNYYKKDISTLKWKSFLFKECKNCIWRIRRKCQGGCLTHKYINQTDYGKRIKFKNFGTHHPKLC